MKFQRLTDELTIYDRTILKIKVIDTHYTSNLKNHSTFIIGNNCKMASESYQINGKFGACINENVVLDGNALVIETPGYKFQEQQLVTFDPTIQGQLSYIDGCSNTNIVNPLRNGDPCINYLFFPSDIKQTFHTHPSIRIGVILEGRGFAEIDKEVFELSKGDKFILDRHARHRFFTTDSFMSLAVFHPDSEDGPRDETNPMKTRTYINNQ